MIHRVYHRELKLVKDKVLVDKCWALHLELQTESSLLLMKYMGLFYKLYPSGLLGLVTLRVQGLERGIHWVIYKELWLEIK